MLKSELICSCFSHLTLERPSHRPVAGFLKDPFLTGCPSTSEDNRLPDIITQATLEVLYKWNTRNTTSVTVYKMYSLSTLQCHVFSAIWATYCITYFLRKPVGIVKSQLGPGAPTVWPQMWHAFIFSFYMTFSSVFVHRFSSLQNGARMAGSLATASICRSSGCFVNK